MVSKKLLWLSVLLNSDNNYILFGFAVATILLSLVTQLTIIANIQVIALSNFVKFKFLNDHPKKKFLEPQCNTFNNHVKVSNLKT